MVIVKLETTMGDWRLATSEQGDGPDEDVGVSIHIQES